MFVIVSFGLYVISQNTANSSGNLSMPIATTYKPVKTTQKPIVVASNPITQTPTPVGVISKKTGIYNDGTYIGNSVDAYYGNVQVEAIISNSKLADIQFLDYPQDRSTSVRINSRALPTLRQEAIQAQSANINAVSGASATSPAFIKSLTSALNQARV